MAVNLVINGREYSYDNSMSGAELLDELQVPASTVVVELNGEIIRREAFLARELVDNDQLELVTIVGGG